MDDLPYLSVIIPVLNEENTVVQSIASLMEGDYPVDKIEFIIADGGSSDETLNNIRRFHSEHSGVRIKVVDNPYKTQGFGLNIAIQQVDHQSEIVVRADGHSIYPKNYVLDCVTTLLSSKADNAGGVMLPVGRDPFQKAVSFCMSHPLGVGDAKFHLGNYSGFVDTVYLGCFKKEIFKKVGLFDPLMTPNEDAEFNLRILKAGGKIYLNNNIRVQYFPRESIIKLIKQYFRYGQGRCRTFAKHRQFTSWRQLIPLVWFILTLILIGMSFISKVFVIPILLYLSIVFFVSVQGSLRNRSLSIMLSSIPFVIMHYAWSLGFYFEMFKGDAKS